jgi:predicted ATPase
MLKRIYIDNYKSLVNFELSLAPLNLFLGPNGAGKSTVFEVLRKLQAFIGGDSKLAELFETTTLTRWQTLHIQRFELEIEGNQGLYKYELAVEHDRKEQKVIVKYERLWFNNTPVFQFEQGEMHLFTDDAAPGPVYPFNWSTSGSAFISPRPENKKLTWFKQYIKQIIVVQIVPALIQADSDQEALVPSYHFENFVSWYRHLSQDQEITLSVTETIRKVLPGFDYFRFEDFGERNRVLKAVYSTRTGAQKLEYSLTELSDGEQSLICLYILLQAAQKNGYLLCLDEPENFLALPEIQPWLIKLYDLCQEMDLQTLLISHHPELINYLLASPVGYWFDRDQNLPTRVKAIKSEPGEGFPISELIARGWLNG